mmetsp:Transcript_27442/g.68728  ORF Transcript_27442/g.68728 Transcript_27442/m.68728 type:complete len:389 (+) Transcript_27442:41-1207(+)
MASPGAATRVNTQEAIADDAAGSTSSFEVVLQSAMVAILAAGTATMQARQLLITQSAEPFGEAAVISANTGLATAYSLGSLAELLLSPTFGSLSDRFGRKPVLLSLLVGPACMRFLCAMITEPRLRIRMLWLDFASARAIGIQPTMGVANTMISDSFQGEFKSACLSRLKATVALGQIIGNYASGWFNASAGPAYTYVITAAVPLMCLAYLRALLPETNPSITCLPEKTVGKGLAPAVCPTRATSNKGAFCTVFSDPKCCLLALALALSEFTNYAPINSVSILFMKKRLGWGPLQAGRFASGVALATFSGAMLMKRIRGAFGDRLGVTLAHCSTALGYLLWGSASSARGMIACLFPMALGSGASPMLLARFQERTKELQLEQGEAENR